MQLEVSGVCKSFGATLALNDVAFVVRAGEVHALAGENGSGKSTLMRILHGEILPESGVLTLEGVRYAPRSPREAMDAGVTLIHQELAVSNHLTVTENIFLGVEKHQRGVLSSREMRSKAEECLAQLGHSDIAPDILCGRLSTAQKQVVEIARAVRADSKVVLFDEPTSSLGHKDVEALFTLIRGLKQQGIAVVYITHFLDEIMTICDRVTVLRDSVNVGSLDVAATTPTKIATLMAGRELGKVFPHFDRSPGEPVMDCSSIRGKKYPVNADLRLLKGEVLGIAGLNGAGRTELVRCLFGLDKLKGGTVVAFEKPMRSNPSGNWRSGIGFVSEDRKGEGLASALSLTENLTLPRPGKVLVSAEDRRARTQAIIDQFQVKCSGPGQKMSSLSGGNQQKIAIGRLVDSESKIMILDEPTRGIDVRSKSEIYHMIHKFAGEGRSVILISSQFGELLGLCDRVMVMRRGEVVGEVLPKESSERELLEMCAGA
ncbi:MAG: sugar ABC transporter ATP-binding protein [Armatimonadetes bacterium]|nr:sugar ABC transporter ATP-binding protein [Armatimonadota bacterium]